MKTLRVFWKGKFDGRSVSINATDFDPALHRLEADGGWDRPVVREPQAVEVAESTPAEPETAKLKSVRKAIK